MDEDEVLMPVKSHNQKSLAPTLLPDTFDACTHPLTAQPQNIGRKIVGKTAPPELVPKGHLAVCPEALPESRLSRELRAPVFGLNLGARNPKPARTPGISNGPFNNAILDDDFR